jgi:hypothetical protein
MPTAAAVDAAGVDGFLSSSLRYPAVLLNKAFVFLCTPGSPVYTLSNRSQCLLLPLLLLLFPLLQATLAAMSMATTHNSNINNGNQQHAPPHSEAAAAAASCCGSPPAMERVVSLAMYLTELALLDAACAALPGSTLATGALLLAHATLAGNCCCWTLLLAAAGSSIEQIAPAVSMLRGLHAAAAAAGGQAGQLLLPLKAKFGQDCWCRVATEVTPLDMQQGAAAAAAALPAPALQQQPQQHMW